MPAMSTTTPTRSKIQSDHDADWGSSLDGLVERAGYFPERNGLHSQSEMARFPIKGRAGLAFTVALVVITLVALPAARWFLAISAVLGVIVAVILRLTSRN